MKLNKQAAEPEFTEGIELADKISTIPEDANRVYTIIQEEEELILPFKVKKGTGNL